MCTKGGGQNVNNRNVKCMATSHQNEAPLVSCHISCHNEYVILTKRHIIVTIRYKQNAIDCYNTISHILLLQRCSLVDFIFARY